MKRTLIENIEKEKKLKVSILLCFIWRIGNWHVSISHLELFKYVCVHVCVCKYLGGGICSIIYIRKRGKCWRLWWGVVSLFDSE